jgi:hypothetical protein
VFGVVASATEVGAVDLTAFAEGAPVTPSLHRTLTPYEARRLAQHLASAADEAERHKTLQVVATA